VKAGEYVAGQLQTVKDSIARLDHQIGLARQLEQSRAAQEHAEQAANEAWDDGKEQMQKFSDELDDEEFYPFNEIAKILLSLPCPVATGLKKCLQSFSNRPGSALFHLVFIELLVVYFFVYAVYTTIHALLHGVAEQMYKEESISSYALSTVEDCKSLFVSGILWEQTVYDAKPCLDAGGDIGGFPEEPLGPMLIFPAGVFGTFFLSIVFVVFVVASFLLGYNMQSAGPREMLSLASTSGKYIQFSYKLKGSKPYRFFGGLYQLGCVVLILGIVGLVLTAPASVVLWFLTSHFPSIVIVAISMRAFVWPTRPRFNYKKDDFKAIVFSSGMSLFTSHSSLAYQLSTAVIAANRGHSGKLKSMLAKPNEWETVLRMIGVNESGDADWFDVFGAILSGDDKAAIKLAVQKLRPKMEPWVKRQNLEWTDIEPLIEEVDSINDLKIAATDFEAFMERISEKSEPIAVKWAILKLRPKLEPHLRKHGLKWTDVEAIIKNCPLSQLQGAVGNPDSFFDYVQAQLAQLPRN